MTVIHNRQDDDENRPHEKETGQNRKCSLCTDPLGYPFLHWHRGLISISAQNAAAR